MPTTWPVPGPEMGMRDSREGDVPAPGPVKSDPVGPGGRDCAGPAESHPPGLGNPDLAYVAGQPADVGGLDRDIPESLVMAGLAPGWLAVSTGEVAGHRLGEVPQRLLLNHLAPVS